MVEEKKIGNKDYKQPDNFLLTEKKEKEQENLEERNQKERNREESNNVIFKKKIDELTNDLKRVQAEFENFKKRIEKENKKLWLLAKMDFVKKLLPIIDTFESAVNSNLNVNEKNDENRNENKNTNDNGLKLIYLQLMKTLASEGLSEIKAKGKFDSHLHEAMMQQESNDFGDDEIIETLQKGYKFCDFVIRPAKVKINIKPRK